MRTNDGSKRLTENKT